MNTTAAQQAADFAPIKARFPEAHMDDDGFPTIAFSVLDHRSDPIRCVLDGEHMVVAAGRRIVGPAQLREMGALLKKAQTAMAKWDNSASGKAFYADLEARISGK